MPLIFEQVATARGVRTLKELDEMMTQKQIVQESQIILGEIGQGSSKNPMAPDNNRNSNPSSSFIHFFYVF